MKNVKILTILVLAIVIVSWAKVSEAAPLGNAFTYQGHLYDANHVANDTYDFKFRLYDYSVTGSQIGSDVNVPDINVIDGYFTVELDFGSVFDGNERWLEIGVRPGELGDPNVYTTLSPRQKITATPYALYAKTAGSGGDSLWQVNGTSIYYNNGNVGIGTTSPAAKLEVNGNIKTAGIYETYMITNWTPVESNRNWYSVAMSADGTKQTAVVIVGQIYISTDSGNTWTAKESSRWWYSVAMSADGTKQTAVVYNGQIYVSTDSGNTWTPVESNRNWRSVAMSADGTKQTAVVQNGQIYVSTDSGNTWTAKESSRNWYSVAMSADGTKQTAVALGGQIYVSTDSGNTWTAKESSRNWYSVAMSADGTKQTAVVRDGQIYVSTDSGNTWTAKESSRNWWSVAMSADGTKQTAVVRDGQIYVSTDSGNTWTAKESDRSWYSVAMSADGTKQTAVVFGGQIYISCIGVGIGTTNPARKLHISDAMRLEPRATAPSSPSEGDIYMDSTDHKLKVYDGTTWQACW